MNQESKENKVEVYTQNLIEKAFRVVENFKKNWVTVHGI